MEASLLYDDKALFARIALDEEQAFRLFFERYKEKVYYFILTMVKSPAETEELVQDVFLRLWVSRQGLAAVDNPGTYLMVMARNRSLDHIKRSAHDRQMKQHLSGKEQNSNYTEQDLDLKQSRQLLEQAISKLSPQQQKVYRLSREAGLNRDQIAEQLGIAPNTVKNHLAEALAAIRTYMQGRDGAILFLILTTPIPGS